MSKKLLVDKLESKSAYFQLAPKDWLIDHRKLKN